MPYPTRRIALKASAAAAIGVALLSVSGCSGNANSQANTGAVFAMSNATADNRIFSYTRASDGTLTRAADISTRGLGIGVDLDTQGALRLSPDNRFLYAVNAGSDDLTVFSVNGAQLTFVQRIPVGDQPNSLTQNGNLIYVLLGSVAEQGITGFRVAADGTLTPIANSTRMLSSPIAVPGIVQFSPDGRVLLVTHKVTNVLVPPGMIIDAFTVGTDGLPSAAPIPNASVGIRPFALTFAANGRALVVEAFNAAMGRSAVSSYDVSSAGAMTPVSRSIPNGQTDACWIVVTPDQRFVFTANFGSGTLSSYSLAASGTLTLLNGQAASLGATSQPVDLSLSPDGQFLFLLLRGTGGVASFRIAADSSLTPLGTVVGGLPVDDGASGLAAY